MLNNKYGGYEYKIDINDNELNANITIDYTKYNMQKFVSDNVAMKEYVNENNELTLEGAKKYYESIGSKCDWL